MGESTGEVTHGAGSQAASADGQWWDLWGESRRLAEQTLVRVRTRLTTWYQKLHLLQEIAEKLFKPWVSERLRVDGLFRQQLLESQEGQISTAKGKLEYVFFKYV